MYASLVAALALAASVSQVSASPVNHVARGYRQDAEILEDYTPYHVRYLALSCQNQHNTQFFEDCCHPLLRWQKLSDRPAKCIPSASASSSAVLAEPTATPIDEDPVYDDDDCDDVTSTPAAAAATSYVAPEPTTTYVAPSTTKEAIKSYTVEPTTSEKPATTKAPETTSEKPSTTKAQATTSATPEGGNDGAFTGGQATWFLQNGNPGACGDYHNDYDLIVAADFRRYGPLDKKSDLCGKKVVITNTDNGNTVTAIVADACPTCKNSNSLDLSLGTFDKLGSRDTGVLPISWYFA